MKRLGIFDIDGTIFRWSLFIETVDAFIKADIFPKSAHTEIVHDYNAWLDRRVGYDIYLGRVMKVYYKYLLGVNEKDAKNIVKRIIIEKKDRVYRFTRDLINKLKKEDYYLLIISNSPLYIVSEFASYWGFKRYYGSETELNKGKFTGRFIPATPKADVLDRFLEESGEKVDLESSVAVGDTESDISILERVGKPIAFNPNMKLMCYSREHDWRIVVERKDVIFDLKKFEIIEKV